MRQALPLEALQALDLIDRKGSFLAAAAAMHKVPSASTCTIRKLEADLGITLFDRSLADCCRSAAA